MRLLFHNYREGGVAHAEFIAGVKVHFLHGCKPTLIDKRTVRATGIAHSDAQCATYPLHNAYLGVTLAHEQVRHINLEGCGAFGRLTSKSVSAAG